MDNISAQAQQRIQDQLDIFFNEGYGNFPNRDQLFEDITERMDMIVENAYEAVAIIDDEDELSYEDIEEVVRGFKLNSKDGHRQLYLCQMLAIIAINASKEYCDFLTMLLEETEDKLTMAQQRLETLGGKLQ